MTSQTVPIQQAAAPARASTALAAVLAMAFGAFLVYGVAFASPASLHNATHDVRHAIAFACH